MKKNTNDTVSRQNTLHKDEVHWHAQNAHTLVNAGRNAAEFLVFMRKPGSFPDKSTLDTKSDVEEVEPSSTNILLENDAVKVIKVELSQDEKIPMHVGTKRVIYSLSNYTAAFKKPDESAEKQSFKQGDVHWHDGGEHSVKNMGDSPAAFLVVEFKK